MAEGATWGVELIVRWILYIAIIILIIWALYAFLLRPVLDTFSKTPEVPVLLLLSAKGFKRGKA